MGPPSLPWSWTLFRSVALWLANWCLKKWLSLGIINKAKKQAYPNVLLLRNNLYFFLIICNVFGKKEECKEENTKFPNAPKKAYNGFV